MNGPHVSPARRLAWEARAERKRAELEGARQAARDQAEYGGGPWRFTICFREDYDPDLLHKIAADQVAGWSKRP